MLPQRRGSTQVLAVMRHNKSQFSEIKTTWAGLHQEGMQLELSCQIAGKDVHFASFVADLVDESLSLELIVQGQSVRLPITQLESLIAAAKKDVHSEAWYDKSLSSSSDS